jgi:D-alanyl-D-alanine dipeptidase
VQERAGTPFAEQLRRAVLAPLGMASSSFAPDSALVRRRARGTMEAPDGRRFAAPTFPLGLGPASELTTTMPDLARFMMMLFAGGATSGGRVLEAATLDSMWGVRPDGSVGEGFGLGFSVGRLDGRLRVSHGGWHYGFGTALVALPRERLGAVVSVTMDAAETPASRVADAALRMLLAAREGRPLPVPAATSPLAAERVAAFEGRWRGRRVDVDLTERRGELWYRDLTPGGSAFPAPLRALGDTLVADGLWLAGPRLLPAGAMLLAGTDTLRPVPPARPAPLPDRWLGVVGEYGWDHDVLYVLERDGGLWALIEWIALYRLVERGRDDFAFPDYGLYAGEAVRVLRDGSGRITGVSLAGVVFPRRAVGPEDGSVYRVTPQRPIAQLRREAARQRPPRQPDSLRAPDLVDLTTLDPGIRLDIRYAGTDNFLGTPLYTVARAMLQRPAAEALVRAQRRLAAAGYGLLIHDAYRPWSVTWMFWQATPRPQRDRGFVANPARGSRHNRGCAVDLTLYELATGRPVAMPSVYDEFTDRASPWYPGGTALQRWHRALLRAAMEAEGFDVEPSEWWHFDWQGWREYPVLDVPLRSEE